MQVMPLKSEDKTSSTACDYSRLNSSLAETLSLEVLRRAADMFPKGLVMTSSLGRYSAVMLHLATSVVADIPVINLRLPGETVETKEHRRRLNKILKLNLRVFDAENDKAGALKSAIDSLEVVALISGVMREETGHREGFEYFMDDKTFSVQRVYPLLHWKEKDLRIYIDRYRLPVNEAHVDIFKEKSEKKECGIHLFEHGGGI